MMLTGDGGELDARGVGWSGGRAAAAEPCDLAVVCQERALTSPVNEVRCDQVACIDGGSTAENASVDTERPA